MFAVLQIIQGDTSLKGRIKGFFRPPEIKTEQVSYNGTPVFYTVTATMHKGVIPWSAVEKSCKSFHNRFLLPEGVTPPQKSNIVPYKSTCFQNVLLFNTMLHYVKLIKPDPIKSSLCISDENDTLCRHIIKAVPYFSKINVITKNKNNYQVICDKILYDYGLSVTLTEKPCYINSDAVMVCLKGEEVPLNFEGTVFTNGNVCALDCFVVRSRQIELPDDIKAILPENIDPLDFAAAMYELSGVEKMSRLVPAQ